MSWFWTAAMVTLCWGVADMFYKGGANERDRYSHLKTAIFVGLVFGAHAIYTLLVKDIGFDWRNLLYYAPVSVMYILSMVLGYCGLRYLELSVSSPVQNCSGALAALLGILILKEIPEGGLSWAGIALCCAGVILMGVFEKKKRSEISAEEKKYSVGFIAFLFPVAYCIIDTLGTFLDDPCLTMETSWLVNVTEETIEDVGNTAYELTFLLVAVVLLVYVLADSRRRGEKLIVKEKYNLSRLAAACFETAGQFFYVRVIGGNAVVAAPMIASYCVVSVILSRIFLKEKLPGKQYISVALSILGIILLGVADGLAGDF